MTNIAPQHSAFILPSRTAEEEQDRLLRTGELFDGLGRRRIIHPDHVGKEKPKLVSYSRVTTYIGALSDTTGLQKWRERLVLRGIADMDFDDAYGEALLAATGADGEVDDKALNAALSDLAEEAFKLAGGRDSADYGTHLHLMIERYLDGTMDIDFMDESEELWPGSVNDFLAFMDEWKAFSARHGVRVLMQETMLVDDEAKLSGRTDIIALLKLPADLRARRAVFDVKTGSIGDELKLAQQLAKYAEMKRYDPETGERHHLRVRQDYGVVIHLPRGEAKCSISLVSLAHGRKANALCAQVRASRRKIPGLIVDPLSLEA